MKRKYWNHQRIAEHNALYNIIIGGRNLGKSYDIKNMCLANSWNTKTISFVLIRRFDLECKPSHIENYFADTPVQAITNGAYNCISAKGGTIYFSTLDMETGKVKLGTPCGKYIALSGGTHVKSEAFPQVTDMIYEEFVSTEYLGDDEPKRLQDLVSTVFRSREGHIWMIGNTVTRLNPYVKHFMLANIAKMEPGQIDDYYFETTNADGEPDKLHIAVEYCKSEGSANKMIFGHAAKAINGGAWECKEHPRLAMPKECYTIIYEVLIDYMNFKFVLQLLTNDETGKRLLYAYPYTNKKTVDRVLTQTYSEDPFHTVWFKRDSEIECAMMDLLAENQIAFSDNLTGDECIQSLKSLKSTCL